MAALSAVGLVQARARRRPARPLHEAGSRDPDARRREAVHDRLRAGRHQPRRPDPDDPLAVRQRPLRPRRLPPLARAVRRPTRRTATSSSTRTSAAGSAPAASSSRCGPRRRRRGRPTSTRAPTPPTRSRGSSRATCSHNGRVGLWGISYGGFYAAAALPRAHPALKAVSPQAPIADLFLGDDSYHNGAFMLAANFSFYTGFFPRRGGPSAKDDNPPFTYGTQDGYAFYLGLGGLREGSARRFPPGNTYWEDNLAHPTYDAFWKARAIAPHLRDVTPAVLTVGGWYDAEDLAGPLRIYRAIERQSPSASNRLVMGPWAHGGWSRGDGDKLGALAFGAKTGAEFRERFERPFFEHHLRDAPLADAPEAAVFVTGENAWRTPPAWPPAEATPRTFYLADGGTLADAPPSRSPQRRRRGEGGRGGRVRQRSEPAGAVRAEPGHRHAPRLHDRGSALRRDAAGRARLPDAAARRGPDVVGPIHVVAARLDDRHRRRLGGQGDRRVSRGRLGAGRRLGRAARRLSAAGARRAVPRQVPRQLRAAGAVRARASRRRSRSICRTSRTRSAAATG